MEVTLQYFTDNGAESVIVKYEHLIGNEYYFSSLDDKQNLTAIRKFPSIVENGFIVQFFSDRDNCDIYDFMQLNREIVYRFDDHENFHKDGI